MKLAKIFSMTSRISKIMTMLSRMERLDIKIRIRFPSRKLTATRPYLLTILKTAMVRYLEPIWMRLKPSEFIVDSSHMQRSLITL
jgi:hypothetical protein